MDVSTGGGTVRVDLTEPPSFPYTKSFESETVVALEAAPSFGHAFDGWGGDLSGTDNPIFVRMECEKNITASFSLDWRLIGTFIGSLIIVLFFVIVLFFRRKVPASTTTDIRD